eukprot:619978-Amorphochlora_amoeboformis.AAC.1
MMYVCTWWENIYKDIVEGKLCEMRADDSSQDEANNSEQLTPPPSHPIHKNSFLSIISPPTLRQQHPHTHIHTSTPNAPMSLQGQRASGFLIRQLGITARVCPADVPRNECVKLFTEKLKVGIQPMADPPARQQDRPLPQPKGRGLEDKKHSSRLHI